MTAGQYKQELGYIRSGVIAQIRKMLKDRGHNDIDFTEQLVFASPEGDEHGTDDLTTDQLVWILEQVENEAYELVDNTAE